MEPNMAANMADNMATNMADDKNDQADVVVVGAGLVGMCTAYYLSRIGYRVVVIERCDRPAYGTSFANAGYFGTACVTPHARPSAFWEVFRLLTPTLTSKPKPTSTSTSTSTSPSTQGESAQVVFTEARSRMNPMNVKISRELVGWAGWYFWSSFPAKFRSNMIASYQLAQLSRDLTLQLIEEERLDVSLAKGFLQVYLDHKTMQSHMEDRQMAQRMFNQQFQVLDQQGVLQLEPNLKELFKSKDEAETSIAGGLYYDSDYTANSMEFCQQMQKACQKRGVDFRFGSEVVSADTVRGPDGAIRVSSLNLASGAKIRGRAFVFCLGPWSESSIRTWLPHIAVGLHIFPVKGHSITVPLLSSETDHVIHHGITIDPPHVYMSPFFSSRSSDDHSLFAANPRLRCTVGTDFVGFDSSFDHDKIKWLVSATSVLFPFTKHRLTGVASSSTSESTTSQSITSSSSPSMPPPPFIPGPRDMSEWYGPRTPSPSPSPSPTSLPPPVAWTGLRPLTPDGLPHIGLLKGTSNAFINGGHGFLGWTLAAGSGFVCANVVANSQPSLDVLVRKQSEFDARANSIDVSVFSPSRFTFGLLSWWR